MSDDHLVHHAEELEGTLRSALGAMLSQSPTDAQCDAVVDRLRERGVARQATTGTSIAKRRTRSAWVTAATVLLCLLWLGAQTEAWAEVVVDYQSANVKDDPSAAPEVIPASAALRFVLMVHVFGLVAGLIGFAIAWSLAQAAWLAQLFSGNSRPKLSRWMRRTLLGAGILYASGIAVGGIWAWQAWGSPWRWDPRESLALVTLGIAALWYSQLRSQRAEPSESRRHDCQSAFVATIAFWLIVLLLVLAPTYASDSHGYGAVVVPNVLSAAAAVNLAIVVLFGRLLPVRAAQPKSG